MADAVPQTERRTPGRVENMVVHAAMFEPVSCEGISIYREKYSDIRFFEDGPGSAEDRKSPFDGHHLSESP
jgi:hypothetical protein